MHSLHVDLPREDETLSGSDSRRQAHSWSPEYDSDSEVEVRMTHSFKISRLGGRSLVQLVTIGNYFCREQQWQNIVLNQCAIIW
jgi:hypothetical protein